MRITADMIISDVLAQRPEAAKVFARFGLGCASCLASGMESVSAVAQMHDVRVEDLLCELNGPDAEPAREEP